MNGKMMLLLAAVLAVPGFSVAQPTTPTGDVQKDVQDIKTDKTDLKKDAADIKADKTDIKKLDAEHSEAVKDLNAKEKAAIAAARADKSLTKDQLKAKLADIRKDFKAQRTALNDKFRNDKKKALGDLKKDKKDARKDRKDLNKDRKDLHEDRQEHGRK